jgi:hypothetical protein
MRWYADPVASHSVTSAQLAVRSLRSQTSPRSRQGIQETTDRALRRYAS